MLFDTLNLTPQAPNPELQATVDRINQHFERFGFRLTPPALGVRTLLAVAVYSRGRDGESTFWGLAGGRADPDRGRVRPRPRERIAARGPQPDPSLGKKHLTSTALRRLIVNHHPLAPAETYPPPKPNFAVVPRRAHV